MKLMFRFSIVLAALLVLSACGDDSKNQFVKPDGPGPWVYVDVYHTTKQNPLDYRLEKGQFGYQGVFGFWRLFEHIENNGYETSYVRDLPISRERLDGFDVLFINLVSSDLPDFSDDEVAAIIEFVENGGGLFVIADHTNVYRHAERVNKFLVPMGVEVLYHIATDQPPDYAIAGLGWILVRDFVDHPVTEGLEMVSLQTGGPMDSRGSGVAFTSTCPEGTNSSPPGCSFADLWDEEDQFGFYGDWTWNGDADAEPLGPLEVVTAKQFGQGRIVVVGDQNMFGDSWLHWGSNFELAVNGIEWLANQESTERPLRTTRPFGVNIGMYQPATRYNGGKFSGDSFFGFFVNANRDLGVTMSGRESLNQKDDVLILTDVSAEMTEAEVNSVRQYLRDGKKVMVTFEADEIRPQTIALLKELAPDFALEVDGTTYDLDALVEDVEVPRKEGKFPGTSDYLAINGLNLASFEGANTEPYLLDVRSTWGDAFLQAGDTDLARIKEVDGGELVIFIQDGFFRNRTFGDYLRAPNSTGVIKGEDDRVASGYNDAHSMQFRLLDWFKSEHASEE